MDSVDVCRYVKRIGPFPELRLPFQNFYPIDYFNENDYFVPSNIPCLDIIGHVKYTRPTIFVKAILDDRAYAVIIRFCRERGIGIIFNVNGRLPYHLKSYPVIDFPLSPAIPQCLRFKLRCIFEHFMLRGFLKNLRAMSADSNLDVFLDCLRLDSKTETAIDLKRRYLGGYGLSELRKLILSNLRVRTRLKYRVEDLMNSSSIQIINGFIPTFDDYANALINSERSGCIRRTNRKRDIAHTLFESADDEFYGVDPPSAKDMANILERVLARGDALNY